MAAAVINAVIVSEILAAPNSSKMLQTIYPKFIKSLWSTRARDRITTNNNVDIVDVAVHIVRDLATVGCCGRISR